MNMFGSCLWFFFTQFATKETVAVPQCHAEGPGTLWRRASDCLTRREGAVQEPCSPTPRKNGRYSGFCGGVPCSKGCQWRGRGCHGDPCGVRGCSNAGDARPAVQPRRREGAVFRSTRGARCSRITSHRWSGAHVQAPVCELLTACVRFAGSWACCMSVAAHERCCLPAPSCNAFRLL